MDIRDSIVGIVAKSSSEKKFSGTGFFVEGGLILTCTHVVNQAQVTDGKVQFRIEGKKQFYDAETIFKSPETDLDICVLQPIDFEKEVPPLKLVMSRQSEGNTFKTFGYPQPTGFQGLRGDGETLGWVRDAQGRDALHISSDEVTHGYSGCPIWDNKADGVVGMLSRGFNFGLDKKLGSAVFAIPCEVLKENYSELVVDEIPTPEPIPTWNLKHPYAMPPNFTGRLTERKMLVDWLQNDSQNRLFILCALGGFGKSALAWHWLTHDVDAKDWPKVVWWSFYEGDASFENFIKETLEYLKVEVSPGQRQQVDTLLKAMSTQKILLIIDGFERALRAYSSMNAAYQSDDESPLPEGEGKGEGEKHRDCVNLNAEIFLKNLCVLPNIKSKVLMTTRLTPRAVYVGASHDSPLQGFCEVELKAMQKEDAVAFFRAQGIRGARAEIEGACAPYGYHPLSLRILAGLIANDRETPADITVVNKIDITDDIIQNKNHVLEISYNSLSFGQQKLLSNMACFRSSINYQTLKIITNKPSWKRDKRALLNENLDDNLQTLESHGLIHWDRTTNKYDLHHIVRRYAYEHLTAADRTGAHKRLMDYFKAVPKPQKVNSIEDITPVIELYHHMVRTGELDNAVSLLQQRLLKPLYYQFGAYQLGIELFRTLFPDGEDKLPRLKNESTQAWTLNGLATNYSLNGQPRRAVKLFEIQNAISKKADDKINLVVGLVNIASTAQIYIGALREAEHNLRCSIDYSRESAMEIDEAIGHKELSRVLTYLGSWKLAKEEFERAVNIPKHITYVQHEGVAWAYRAQIFSQMARANHQSKIVNLKLSIEYAKHALDLADVDARADVPTPRDYVRAYWLLGTAYCSSALLHPNQNDAFKELDLAEENLSKAINLCWQINAIDAEADILLDIARLRYAQGEFKDAQEKASEALLITERSGYVLQGADVHLFLATLAVKGYKLQVESELSDKDAARLHAKKALELATCDGPPYYYKVAYEEAERFLENLK